MVSLARTTTIRNLGRLLSLAAVATAFGCASGRVSLQSTPAQVDVYVASLGTEAPKLIGQTPLNMKSSELETHHGGAGPVEIEFRKDGFAPLRIYVTEVSSGDLKINAVLNPSNGLESFEKVNEVVDQTFEVQRLARVGKLDEALSKLSDLKKLSPQVAAIYELEGGIYYIQKKYKEAYDSFKLASRYNPKNPETLRMLQVIENQVRDGEKK